MLRQHRMSLDNAALLFAQQIEAVHHSGLCTIWMDEIRPAFDELLPEARALKLELARIPDRESGKFFSDVPA
jgi:hypothetical protein